MSMPNHLVLVRHGQSEANIIQKAEKNGGSPHEQAGVVTKRPDWQQRLSYKGIEQAKIAGEWLRHELGGVAAFDLRYVSSFLRARETAGHLSGDETGEWIVDDRIMERDWGVYGAVSDLERQERFAWTREMHEISPWYTRLDGGQSRSDISMPFRDFQGTLHREAAGKKVLVVAHGDFIATARYNLERMLPEQFEDVESDEDQTIRNCTAVEYTRVNPREEDDIRDKLHWLRITNPVNPELSPFGGDWVELPSRPKFSGADLLGQVALAPRLLTD